MSIPGFLRATIYTLHHVIYLQFENATGTILRLALGHRVIFRHYAKLEPQERMKTALQILGPN